ncbi:MULTISPECIES: hypothetical protein [Nonlabens]|uniref:Lipoprotein n=2 Tax=Nonlabens TaxID=363408 RepID=A0A2S7U9M2_9FLAO|nr:MULTISPECIES: hypothetical protein [Nonlabens]PQJ31094.1 hypothetical protein BST92_03765 [Nonlabens arenilitoris]GAK90297.1 hypothetical protein JCM19297_2309 [Nonlabens ulvanivorans]GAK91929.1 hypothetical protein JCM19298_2417 [Nonlabens ulvanivorans]GAL00203.1 hypothetical protein JCM19314_457 [Nonlabens ulvanivorans]|tara:strand:+ start:235 stop:465 length:231 start_codon:yes stop_codon:yes gene_type:complete
MKNPIQKILLILLFSISLTACRNEAETAEEKAEDLIENADEMKVKEDKIKIENEDGSEAKIKYDENGDVEKVKTDN